MWQATVSVEGGGPVNLIIDNGINEIYLQALVRLDYDGISPDERTLLITAAMKALEPYSTVGLAELAGNVFLRSAFFVDHCNMHAFTKYPPGYCSGLCGIPPPVADNCSGTSGLDFSQPR